MMNIRKIMLSAVLISASGLFAADAVPSDAKDLIRKTELTRQQNLHRGDFLVREGHKLFEDGNFFGARDKYMEAIKLFRQYPSKFFQEKIEFCQKEIAACYYAKANEAIIKSDKMALASDFDEAIKICREAIKYCPEQADELQKRIYLYEKRRDSVVHRSAFTTERLIPGKESQDYQIQVLLEQARRLAAAKDYSSALFKYNEVLLIDPYNANATQGRRAVSNLIGQMGEKRYVNTHRRAVAEIEWKYAMPIIPEASGNASNVVATAVAKSDSIVSSKIYPKLKQIKVSGLAFDSKPISVIVNTLQEQSRNNDPDTNSKFKGVNIVYIGNVFDPEGKNEQGEGNKTTAKQAPVRKAKNDAQRGNNADESDEEGEQTEAEQDPYANEPKVTLISSRERTLLEALVLLCKSAKPKLNMQIDDYAVVLTPENITLNNMIFRSYPVTIDPKLEAKKASEITEAIQKVIMVEGGQSIMPNGSSLFYNRDTRRVSVTNTPENHQKIQKILEEAYKPQDPLLVQVMVKMVDINQNDLDELAFNWQLAVNSLKKREENGKLSSSAIMDINNPLLRYYNVAGDRPGGTVNSSTLSYVWQNEKGTRVVASMFAMNQADSSDVLMSPRITVKAGAVATIKMVEQHNFPEEDWETPDEEIGDTYRLRPSPQPTLDNEQELGVILTIQPQVNGNLIKAPINVTFKSLAGWSEYDTRQYNADGTLDDGDYYRMPILNEPSVKTMITAKDGETIIAGGIVADETSTINDKIPVLGDLPFIGRLFQSNGSKSTKRNLLVFVTFRLVKPDGSPAFPRYQNDGISPQGYPRYGSGL